MEHVISGPLTICHPHPLIAISLPNLSLLLSMSQSAKKVTHVIASFMDGCAQLADGDLLAIETVHRCRKSKKSF